MRYEIILAPQAIADLKRLDAYVRAKVRDAIEVHLRHEPTKVSRSRIKHLRGIRKPQYRLRVNDVRVFYDVTERKVEVLADRGKAAGRRMAGAGRRTGMKKVALSAVKDDLSRYLKLAEKEEILITRHGRPAGVLVGFADEDDWFDYRLENDPRFLVRIEKARRSVKAGRGVPLEDIR